MIRSLGQKDPLEEELATHSSILAWKIPWTEEPGRLQSLGSQRVVHNWTHVLYDTFFFLAAFTILFVFDFWELDYDLSQWKFLWFISVWASLNIIYLDGHLSPQICVDVCVFDVVVTSSSLFGPASVGKDIHLKVTVRMPAGLDAMPLVHGKAWWCNLHAAVSAEVNISAHCRGVFCGQDHGMWVAVVARASRLYRGYHC